MRHTSHWDRTKYLYICGHDSATYVVSYMCDRLYVQSATCVVGYICGYDLLTTEVSFMRGYTGDKIEIDRYRYRT